MRSMYEELRKSQISVCQFQPLKSSKYHSFLGDNLIQTTTGFSANRQLSTIDLSGNLVTEITHIGKFISFAFGCV